MTSYLIDINVWLALSWALHPHSAAAHGWLASRPRPQTRLLFCRVTQLGLMRLLTNAAVMGGSVLNIAGAIQTVDRWSEDPRVELVSEPMGVDPALRRALRGVAARSATKAIMDAYLAAFAEALPATLITFDKALAKIAGRRPHIVLRSR
ncbi:MAG: PIN domain-containing protein [Bryobacterales bacterium]|nr:PIN domain-containing protein [Bryobacterales bacterium]MBV9401523.1 PIN domain-containing protein [Bryobacterales bacterium]